jgi:GAF domain-containing protein
MSRDAADRHSSAAELGREVQSWQDRQRRQAEEELRRAYDRLHRQQAALVALTRTNVFPGPDLDTVLRRLVEGAARTLAVERVSVWQLSPDRQTLRCRILYELGTGRFSSGTELNAREYPHYFAALAATDVLAAEDARTDPRTREFTEGYLVPLGIGAMMEVPIRPDGVLCHEHVGPPRPWLPDEELFGLAVGHLVAHAISHWQVKGTAAPGL